MALMSCIRPAAAGLISVLLLGGCASPRQAAPAVADERDRLAVHTASLRPGAEHTIPVSGQQGMALYRAPEPILIGTDVTTVSRTIERGEPKLYLDLAPEAAERLYGASDTYVNHYLVLLWKGQVVFAPFARSPLREKLVIIGDTEQLSMETFDEIAAVFVRECASP